MHCAAGAVLRPGAGAADEPAPAGAVRLRRPTCDGNAGDRRVGGRLPRLRFGARLWRGPEHGCPAAGCCAPPATRTRPRVRGVPALLVVLIVYFGASAAIGRLAALFGAAG